MPLTKDQIVSLFKDAGKVYLKVVGCLPGPDGWPGEWGHTEYNPDGTGKSHTSAVYSVALAHNGVLLVSDCGKKIPASKWDGQFEIAEQQDYKNYQLILANQNLLWELRKLKEVDSEIENLVAKKKASESKVKKLSEKIQKLS